MKSGLIDDDEEQDQVRNDYNKMDVDNLIRGMATVCGDEVGNGDSAHNRRKTKKKWVQLPLGDIPLTYSNSRQIPSQQLNQRDRTQSINSNVFFNAWKGKKGSDLFTKKESDTSREEQPLLNSAQRTVDEMPNCLMDDCKLRKEEEMLEKALIESVRTAQQEEEDRLFVLRDIANISEDEQLLEEDGAKSVASHSEDRNSLNRQLRDEHRDIDNTSSSDVLIKKNTFVSYPVKHSTQLLNKTTVKQFVSDQYVGPQSRSYGQNVDEQQNGEKIIRRKTSGTRLPNHTYNFKSKNRSVNFSKSEEINNNCTSNIRTTDKFESTVKRVMSRSDCKNDNFKSNKILIDSAPLKQKTGSLAEAVHAGNHNFLKTKNGHDYVPPYIEKDTVVCLPKDNVSDPLIAVDPAPICTTLLFNSGTLAGGNQVPSVINEDISPATDSLLMNNTNVCALLNNCQPSLDVVENSGNGVHLRSLPVEMQERKNSKSNEVSTTVDQTLISSVWGSQILESQKDETGLSQLECTVKDTVSAGDGRKKICSNSDRDSPTVKHSRGDSGDHIDEGVHVNTYQNEFREIVRDFLKSKENDIIDFVMSQFIAENVSVGQSASVKIVPSRRFSCDECFKVLQEQRSCAAALQREGDICSSESQEYSKSSDQHCHHFVQANGNCLEGLKLLVRQVITECSDVKEKLLRENKKNDVTCHQCDSRQPLNPPYLQQLPYSVQLLHRVPSTTEPQEKGTLTSHYTSQISPSLQPVVPHIALRPFAQTEEQQKETCSERVTGERFVPQEGDHQVHRSTIPLMLQPQPLFVLPYQNSYLPFHPTHSDVMNQYQWTVDNRVSQTETQADPISSTADSNDIGNGGTTGRSLHNGKHEQRKLTGTLEHQELSESSEHLVASQIYKPSTRNDNCISNTVESVKENILQQLPSPFTSVGPFTSASNVQRSMQQSYPPLVLPGFRMEGTPQQRGRDRYQLN